MRLIDADLLGLTDMEIIMCDGDYKKALKMLIDKIEHAPTVTSDIEMEKAHEELEAHIEYLNRQNDVMRGEIKALKFAIRCNGVSGSEVQYD